MEIVYYDDLELGVEYQTYSNGRIAIQLNDYNSVELPGEPYCKATVNVPEASLESDEVIIKNYSENMGLDDALIESGLTEDTGKRINVGYVTVPIHKLLKK